MRGVPTIGDKISNLRKECNSSFLYTRIKTTVDLT
jgi:hypothetical protein